MASDQMCLNCTCSCSKEEPEACNGELDFICGTHFDAEGHLNKHGAEEDFDHIDEDKSGYLRFVSLCAFFEV